MLLASGEFPGERFSNGRVIVVKTHLRQPKEMLRYERVILLVRNPLDAILAEYNRRKAGKVAHAAQRQFRSKGNYEILRGIGFPLHFSLTL